MMLGEKKKKKTLGEGTSKIIIIKKPSLTGAHQLETKPCLLGDKQTVTTCNMPDGPYLKTAALSATVMLLSSQT